MVSRLPGRSRLWYRAAMRLAYQGEPGAFSEAAAERLVPGAETVPYRTFEDVFAAVASGAVTHGVLPMENSVGGSIHRNYDLLSEHELPIVGEVELKVEHNLLALPGVGIADIRRVYSHPQALAQCERFLSRHAWSVVPTADTAGAARQLASDRDPRVAAIASERAATLYGLRIGARDIQDATQNVTRFAVIARSRSDLHEAGSSLAARETLITFETGHRPGDLVRALTVLADAGINLSRIESRPSGDGPWRYRFLVQVAGDAAVDPLRGALLAMREHTRAMRVLGSFAAG